MKATVCIPAFNEEVHIGRLLGEVSEYNRETVSEILVCANGCTDQTEAIVREWGGRDGRITLITSRPGKPNAWNRLVETARNDILVFFDADVYLGEKCITRLIWGLASDPRLLGVGGEYLPLNVCSNISDAITRLIALPFGYAHLVGRVYAFRKQGLLNNFRRHGYPASMPENLLYEDLWLRAFFPPGSFRIINEAIVYFHPETFYEVLKGFARSRLAIRQMVESFPMDYKRIIDNPQNHANRSSGVLRQLSGATPVSYKMEALTGLFLRKLLKIFFRTIIDKLYLEMRQEFLHKGGAHILAGAGRAEVSKMGATR